MLACDLLLALFDSYIWSNASLWCFMPSSTVSAASPRVCCCYSTTLLSLLLIPCDLLCGPNYCQRRCYRKRINRPIRIREFSNTVAEMFINGLKLWFVKQRQLGDFPIFCPHKAALRIGIQMRFGLLSVQSAYMAFVGSWNEQAFVNL